MKLRTIPKVCFCAALVVVALTHSTEPAQRYVSLNGGFYFSYPDEWAQVDYWLVDNYLMTTFQKLQLDSTLDSLFDSTIFNYEAVFAQKDVPYFYSGEYLILTVDTVGKLKDWQIDSVLIELVEDIGHIVEYHRFSDFLADPKLDVPVYDTLDGMAALLTEVPGDGLKKSLTVMKFYDKGVATFYFYTPDSLFDASKERFERVLASFSIDMEKALPKEKVKIADLEDVGKKKSSTKTFLFFGVALVLILIIIVRRVKR
jgi:hypothetical protein